jgi:hypothetical protein
MDRISWQGFNRLLRRLFGGQVSPASSHAD